jgi:hypothetical protein
VFYSYAKDATIQNYKMQVIYEKEEPGAPPNWKKIQITYHLRIHADRIPLL